MHLHSVLPSASCLLMVSLLGGALADPFPTDRDRILSEADTFYNLEWYCSSSNIYVAGSTGYEDARCDYSTPGWYTNMPYKWGGYDTVDGFLSDMAAGLGAGDTDTSSPNGNTSGVDCSGYVSRLWESGRYATASFANASYNIDLEDLRMGDAMNKAGSHIRLFVRWEDASTMWVYEATAGAGHPWRVVQRPLSLSSFTGYVPIRYDLDADSTNFVRIDPEPTIQWIVETSPGTIWMPFDGEADNGYRVEHATDGTNWQTIRTEANLNSAAFRVDVSSVTANENHFYRVIAVNSGGPTEPSDTLAFRRGAASGPRVLLVDGMDRWRADGHVGHTFLVPVAQSLGRLGIDYESCSNEMVAVGMVDLNDYDLVIWMVGDDSTNDESISRGEQWHIENYLEQGGDLFLSGSEIMWDLDHHSVNTRFQDPTDGPFMLNYLKVDYQSDGDEGNGYLAEGLAGAPLGGAQIHFDDGTHGTYDVFYPDSYAPQAGGEAWLQYPSNGETAMTSWEGQFGSSAEMGRIVMMGFGLETVYIDAERDAILRAVLGIEPPTSSGLSMY